MVFLIRMEKPGDSDFLTGFKRWWGELLQTIKGKAGRAGGFLTGWRLPLVPQIVDTYVLSSFLFYLAVVLASFVSMSEVYFFFELVPDMIRNNISLLTMFWYLFFLTPELIYTLLPLSPLVAVLVSQEME